MHPDRPIPISGRALRALIASIESSESGVLRARTSPWWSLIVYAHVRGGEC